MVNNLRGLVREIGFVRTFEAPPPQYRNGNQPNLEKYLDKLKTLNGYVDFVNISDGYKPHYDSLEASKIVQEEIGKPVILHITCRESIEETNKRGVCALTRN